MTQDEAQALARELVETRIQKMELERLNYLNALREHEAQIAIRKDRAESDIAATAAQLMGQ
jgi:hypothetical protein